MVASRLSIFVMPGLTRHPASLRREKEAGCRLKAGMTGVQTL
jgi:hypothetical protein